MDAFLEQPSKTLFRAATLLGCLALLLGVAGIFYFGVREETAREVLPEDAATVLLQGIGALEDIEVDVLWLTPSGRPRQETGRPGKELGLWYFSAAPAGRPVKLLVYRRGERGRRLLHEQRALLTRGAGFEVFVRER